jgi:RNA polymerase sigma factor (sigma-70 family)
MTTLSTSQNDYFLKCLKRSDRIVFTEIYNTYSDAIFSNICRLVKTTKEAEDILQEVFVLLWNKREDLHTNIKIDGWLFNTSYLKSLEYLRKDISASLVSMEEVADRNELISPELDIDVECIYIEKLQLLRDAIDNLSTKRKDAFVLCKVRGKTYSEAAEIMGISATSVKDYVKTANKLVKKYALINDATLSLLIMDIIFKKYF